MAKWLSKEVFQTFEKRREVKDKGEEERYTHLNVEFQRIALRDFNYNILQNIQSIDTIFL